MDLSVIIPAYNSGTIIRSTLDSLWSYLPDHFSSFEIIVVDDGSSDNTFKEISAFKDSHIKIIQHKSNQGKYGAIKTGMLSASGTCRIFTDADLPYEVSAIPYLAHLIRDLQYHLAVGDRTLMESIDRSGTDRTRHFLSISCRTAVRLLVAGEMFDTQCGLKAIRSDVADAIFPLIKERGFAGDIELLYIALKYNLAIRRVPVRLLRSGQTSVRLSADGLKILKRLILLRSAWERGDYYSQHLMQIAKQEY
jgi:glycosyltransferase involved in cell wall biosynthesis